MRQETLRLFSQVLWALLLFCSTGLVSGEDNASALPKIERAGDGLYRFGDIIINKPAGEISFPGVTNQVNGLIEYGIVHDSGKIHESLFRTAVRPQLIHTSLLLLKHRPAKDFFENLWAEEPKEIDYSAHSVRITVSWELNATKHRLELASMALNEKNKKAIPLQSFVFTGSRIVEGTFMAESAGSILAVYADDVAIINSSAHDSDNDDVWYANKEKMPPLECPVTLRFHLPRGEGSGKLPE